MMVMIINWINVCFYIFKGVPRTVGPKGIETYNLHSFWGRRQVLREIGDQAVVHDSRLYRNIIVIPNDIPSLTSEKTKMSNQGDFQAKTDSNNSLTFHCLCRRFLTPMTSDLVTLICVKNLSGLLPVWWPGVIIFWLAGNVPWFSNALMTY